MELVSIKHFIQETVLFDLQTVGVLNLKNCPGDIKDFELKIKSWRKYTILKGVGDNQKEDL